MEMKDKKILDVTCGGRSIWFNKNHPLAVYCDRRVEEHVGTFGATQSTRHIRVNPDVVCDFTDLPFEDESFSLVVFDPPHVEGLSPKSWTLKRYGTLDENWREMLHEGFAECMRVLKPYGILIFKWSEVQIPTPEVIKVLGQKPLFGHHSGKKMNTNWLCFMKDVSDTDTVDAVPVVRCKDCQFAEYCTSSLRWKCKRGGTYNTVHEKDYCSWGVRNLEVRNG